MAFRLPVRGYRLRVILFAGLMVLLVLTSIGFTVGVAWYSKRTTLALVERDFRVRQIGLSFVDTLLSMERNRKKFLLLKKEEYRDRFFEDLRRLGTGLEELEGLGLTEAERSSWVRLRTFWEGLHAENPFGEQRGGESAQAPAEVPLDEVHRLLGVNQESMKDRITEMGRLEGETIRLGILWGGLSLVVAGGLSFFLVRSVTVPIGLLRQGTREIAEGRFGYRIPLSSQDELGDLADAFNEMAERLQHLDDLKADFMAIVSHELKTPLTSMKEAVELLREGAAGPLNEKQGHLLDINAQGIEKLAHLVDEILSLTRMEAGMLDLCRTWTDFGRLLEERLVAFRLLAEKKRIALHASLRPDPLPLVQADAERLKQVLDNLLDNAIRFTPAGGRVSIAVEYVDKGLPGHRPRENGGGWTSGAGLVCRVSDTGEGIPPAERKRVFEKFYQIRRKTSRSSGSGLGLSIAKHIIEAHGGAIWVEDAAPRGASFVFTLPQEHTGRAGASVAGSGIRANRRTKARGEGDTLCLERS